MQDGGNEYCRRDRSHLRYRDTHCGGEGVLLRDPGRVCIGGANLHLSRRPYVPSITRSSGMQLGEGSEQFWPLSEDRVARRIGGSGHPDRKQVADDVAPKRGKPLEALKEIANREIMATAPVLFLLIFDAILFATVLVRSDSKGSRAETL